MPSKDSINAALRHVYTATGVLIAAVGAVAIAMGMMTQDQLDKILAAVKSIGDNSASIIAAVGVLVGVLNALRAARSASPAQQIKKVESMDGLEVTPTTAQGAELVKRATGTDKPVQ